MAVPGEGWWRPAGSAPQRGRARHRDRLAPEGRRPAPTPATATQPYGASPLGKAFWHVLSARISKLPTAGGMRARPELWPARRVTKTEEPAWAPRPGCSRLSAPPTSASGRRTLPTQASSQDAADHADPSAPTCR